MSSEFARQAPVVVEVIAWVGFAVLLGAAAFSDIRWFRIPNTFPMLIVVAFLVRAVVAPERAAVAEGLYACAVVLAAGFPLFFMRLMGGGDIKLMAAASLWIGINSLPAQLFLVAAAGLLLALTLMVLRHVVAFDWPGRRRGVRRHLPPPRVLRKGEPIPYGVAIAAGSLAVGALMFAGGVV